jgi:hypothetical protein
MVQQQNAKKITQLLHPIDVQPRGRYASPFAIPKPEVVKQKGVRQLNAARDRQIFREGYKDTITHEPKVMGLAESGPKARSENKSLLTSTSDLSQVFTVKPPYGTGETNDLQGVIDFSRVAVKAPSRRYNILNGESLNSLGSTMQYSKSVMIEDAAERYWKTHNFDPLLQSYIDPRKEQSKRGDCFRRTGIQSYRKNESLIDFQVGTHEEEPPVKGRDLQYIYETLASTHDTFEKTRVDKSINTRARRGVETHYLREFDIISGKMKSADWNITASQALNSPAGTKMNAFSRIQRDSVDH